MPVALQDTASAESRSACQAPDPAAAKTSSHAGADVETLLRQLAEQKEATTRALRSTLAIEKQLADTREELNRALMMASIPPDPPKKEVGADGGAQQESVLDRAHQELEKERQARNDERVVAAAHIARLEETVAHARTKEKTAMDSLRRTRMLWIIVSAAVLCGAMFLTRLAARYPQTSVAAALRSGFGSAEAPSERKEIADEPSEPAPAEEKRTARTANEGMAPEAALEDAVAHMNRALAAYPDEKPDEIIEALRKGRMNIDPSSCLLAWNDGQPELLLQDRGGDRVKIAGTLSACAAAIETAHHNMIFRGRSQKDTEVAAR